MKRNLLLNITVNKSQKNTVSYLGFLVLFFLLICNNAVVSAQNLASDYAFSSSVGSGATAYSDLSGATVVAGAAGASFGNVSAGGNNPINATANIGFNFIFNNVSYSQVIINDNGFLVFGTSVSPGSINNPIASALGFGGVVAGFAGHLVGNFQDATNTAQNNSAFISYKTTGSAGSQVFTAEWRNVKRKSSAISTVSAGLLNFQIRLYEADMRIEVQYKAPVGAVTSLAGQVGLRGLTNANNDHIAETVSWGSPTTVSNNSAATIGLSSASGPVDNLIWTWTPTCVNPTNLTATLQFDNPTFSSNFSWTRPLFDATATGYIYEVRLTSSPFTTIAGPTTISGMANTSASVSGLQAGVSYTIYVRSNCKAFAQSITTTVSPSCVTAVFPYSEDFEAITVPAIPPCTSVVATTGLTFRTVQNGGAGYYGFANKNLITGDASTTNTWFFSRLISLTNGNVYRLSYKYGGSRELAQFNQKMKVMLGSVASAAGMTTLLADHPNIKSSPNTFTFNFTFTGATGSYYLGFNGYAAATQGYLQIDDISLTNPTCFPPTALAVNSITYNSAILSWTAPSPAPSSGYEYYFSTSATAPIATTTVSGLNLGTVTNLTSLAASSTYYVWVRSNCGGEVSIWSTVASFATPAAPPTPCVPNPSSVDSNGIINVTIGSINNTTGRETNNYGNYTTLSTNVAQNTTVNMSLTYSVLGFLGGGYYTRIWIDYNDDGDFFDAGETVFTNGGAELPNGVNNISFLISASAPLGSHRMRIGGSDSNDLSQVVAPATSNGPCYTGSYGTFEDYTVFVTSPPPPLTLSSTSTSYCSGGSSPLVTLTAGAGYDNFVWNPNVGVTGNSVSGWTFNPTTAGVLTYTLTATQASGLFLSNTATYVITVYDVPSPVVFSPSTVAVCENIPTALTSSGGIVSGALIFEENFNGATNSFTTVNNSTGGVSPPAAAWTLRTSPHLYSSTTFISNDSSQFYISNSDAQGSGSSSTTNTELISPVLNFTGYTNVSLSYWQYYKGFNAGTADTQVWIDNNPTNGLVDVAEVVTTVNSFSTANSGTPSNFSNQIIDLSAFAGQNNVRLRFKYTNATWAWYWALDNVKITGSGAAALAWSPTTGLYTDAAGTVPYAGGAVAAIYAKLNSDQTYTATATAGAPGFCPTSSVLNVTVTKAGIAAGDQNLSCGNTNLTSNITLTGYVPSVPATITGWQMDDNPAFTSPVTIAGSAGKDVLTPGDVGNLSGVTYFRAMINGCPTLYSNTVTATFTNSKTWNGSAWVPAGTPGINDNVTVASGTLNITADMSVCNFRVSTGATVNVNPGVTLTVSGAVVVSTFGSGGTLNFKSENGPNPPYLVGSASLMQDPASTTNLNTGVAKYERWTKTRKFDYTYWSSPMNPMTLINVSPTTLSDKFLKYDSNANTWTYPNPALTTMTQGVGYAIRGPQAYSTTVLTDYKATFSGSPNNGNYSVLLYHNANASNPYFLNFLGNPYPSAISADLLMDGNPGPLGALGVGTTFYFWTHNTQFNGSAYVFSDYAAYNRTGGVGTAPGTPTAGGNNATPNGIISAGQGFMVSSVTAGTVTFTNSMRVAGSNLQFFRLNNTVDKSRIWLNYANVNDSDEFKQLLVGYLPNATNQYENGFDGEVIEAGNTVSFYSRADADTKNLMIQGRALPFAATDLVPLGYRATTASTYEIALSNYDGLFEDTSVGIYLEDTMLNIIHDLRQAPYQFVTESGIFDSRFVLRYNNGLLSTNQLGWNENNVVVFKQNEQIRVESSIVKMKSVKIFDMQGRLVIEKNNINSQSTQLQNVGLANQVLMVQITSVDGVTVNKKIIF